MEYYLLIVGISLVVIAAFVLINIAIIDMARSLVNVWESKKSALLLMMLLVGIDIIVIYFIIYALKG